MAGTPSLDLKNHLQAKDLMRSVNLANRIDKITTGARWLVISPGAKEIENLFCTKKASHESAIFMPVGERDNEARIAKWPLRAATLNMIRNCPDGGSVDCGEFVFYNSSLERHSEFVLPEFDVLLMVHVEYYVASEVLESVFCRWTQIQVISVFDVPAVVLNIARDAFANKRGRIYTDFSIEQGWSYNDQQNGLTINLHNNSGKVKASFASLICVALLTSIYGVVWKMVSPVLFQLAFEFVVSFGSLFWNLGNFDIEVVTFCLTLVTWGLAACVVVAQFTFFRMMGVGNFWQAALHRFNPALSLEDIIVSVTPIDENSRAYERVYSCSLLHMLNLTMCAPVNNFTDLLTTGRRVSYMRNIEQISGTLENGDLVNTCTFISECHRTTQSPELFEVAMPRTGLVTMRLPQEVHKLVMPSCRYVTNHWYQTITRRPVVATRNGEGELKSETTGVIVASRVNKETGIESPVDAESAEATSVVATAEAIQKIAVKMEALKEEQVVCTFLDRVKAFARSLPLLLLFDFTEAPCRMVDELFVFRASTGKEHADVTSSLLWTFLHKAPWSPVTAQRLYLQLRGYRVLIYAPMLMTIMAAEGNGFWDCLRASTVVVTCFVAVQLFIDMFHGNSRTKRKFAVILILLVALSICLQFEPAQPVISSELWTPTNANIQRGYSPLVNLYSHFVNKRFGENFDILRRQNRASNDTQLYLMELRSTVIRGSEVLPVLHYLVSYRKIHFSDWCGSYCHLLCDFGVYCPRMDYVEGEMAHSVLQQIATEPTYTYSAYVNTTDSEEAVWFATPNCTFVLVTESDHLTEYTESLLDAGATRVFSERDRHDGQRGCYKAHQEAARRAIRVGCARYVVFEADAGNQQSTFGEQYRELSEQLIELEADTEARLLYLGHTPRGSLRMYKNNRFIFETSAPYANHAYVSNSAGALTILNLTFPLVTKGDLVVRDIGGALVVAFQKKYAVVPHLFHQMNNVSTTSNDSYYKDSAHLRDIVNRLTLFALAGGCECQYTKWYTPLLNFYGYELDRIYGYLPCRCIKDEFTSSIVAAAKPALVDTPRVTGTRARRYQDVYRGENSTNFWKTFNVDNPGSAVHARRIVSLDPEATFLEVYNQRWTLGQNCGTYAHKVFNAIAVDNGWLSHTRVGLGWELYTGGVALSAIKQNCHWSLLVLLFLVIAVGLVDFTYVEAVVYRRFARIPNWEDVVGVYVVEDWRVPTGEHDNGRAGLCTQIFAHVSFDRLLNQQNAAEVINYMNAHGLTYFYHNLAKHGSRAYYVVGNDVRGRQQPYVLIENGVTAHVYRCMQGVTGNGFVQGKTKILNSVHTWITHAVLSEQFQVEDSGQNKLFLQVGRMVAGYHGTIGQLPTHLFLHGSSPSKWVPVFQLLWPTVRIHCYDTVNPHQHDASVLHTNFAQFYQTLGLHHMTSIVYCDAYSQSDNLTIQNQVNLLVSATQHYSLKHIEDQDFVDRNLSQERSPFGTVWERRSFVINGVPLLRVTPVHHGLKSPHCQDLRYCRCQHCVGYKTMIENNGALSQAEIPNLDAAQFWVSKISHNFETIAFDASSPVSTRTLVSGGWLFGANRLVRLHDGRRGEELLASVALGCSVPGSAFYETCVETTQKSAVQDRKLSVNFGQTQVPGTPFYMRYERCRYWAKIPDHVQVIGGATPYMEACDFCGNNVLPGISGEVLCEGVDFNLVDQIDAENVANVDREIVYLRVNLSRHAKPHRDRPQLERVAVKGTETKVVSRGYQGDNKYRVDLNDVNPPPVRGVGDFSVVEHFRRQFMDAAAARGVSTGVAQQKVVMISEKPTQVESACKSKYFELYLEDLKRRTTAGLFPKAACEIIEEKGMELLQLFESTGLIEVLVVDACWGAGKTSAIKTLLVELEKLKKGCAMCSTAPGTLNGKQNVFRKARLAMYSHEIAFKNLLADKGTFEWLIIDEWFTVDFNLLLCMLAVARTRGIKVVFVGGREQFYAFDREQQKSEAEGIVGTFRKVKPNLSSRVSHRIPPNVLEIMRNQCSEANLPFDLITTAKNDAEIRGPFVMTKEEFVAAPPKGLNVDVMCTNVDNGFQTIQAYQGSTLSQIKCFADKKACALEAVHPEYPLCALHVLLTRVDGNAPKPVLFLAGCAEGIAFFRMKTVVRKWADVAKGPDVPVGGLLNARIEGGKAQTHREKVDRFSKYKVVSGRRTAGNAEAINFGLRVVEDEVEVEDEVPCKWPTTDRVETLVANFADEARNQEDVTVEEYLHASAYENRLDGLSSRFSARDLDKPQAIVNRCSLLTTQSATQQIATVQSFARNTMATRMSGTCDANSLSDDCQKNFSKALIGALLRGERVRKIVKRFKAAGTIHREEAFQNLVHSFATKNCEFDEQSDELSFDFAEDMKPADAVDLLVTRVARIITKNQLKVSDTKFPQACGDYAQKVRDFATWLGRVRHWRSRGASTREFDRLKLGNVSNFAKAGQGVFAKDALRYMENLEAALDVAVASNFAFEVMKGYGCEIGCKNGVEQRDLYRPWCREVFGAECAEIDITEQDTNYPMLSHHMFVEFVKVCNPTFDDTWMRVERFPKGKNESAGIYVEKLPRSGEPMQISGTLATFWSNTVEGWLLSTLACALKDTNCRLLNLVACSVDTAKAIALVEKHFCFDLEVRGLFGGDDGLLVKPPKDFKERILCLEGWRSIKLEIVPCGVVKRFCHHLFGPKNVAKSVLRLGLKIMCREYAVDERYFSENFEGFKRTVEDWRQEHGEDAALVNHLYHLQRQPSALHYLETCERLLRVFPECTKAQFMHGAKVIRHGVSAM